MSRMGSIVSPTALLAILSRMWILACRHQVLLSLILRRFILMSITLSQNQYLLVAIRAPIRAAKATRVMRAGPTAMAPARQMTIAQVAWCAWVEPAVAAIHVTTSRVRAIAVIRAGPTAVEPARQMTIAQEAWCAWVEPAVAAIAATTPLAPATTHANVWGPVPTPRAPAMTLAPANNSLRRRADSECAADQLVGSEIQVGNERLVKANEDAGPNAVSQFGLREGVLIKRGMRLPSYQLHMLWKSKKALSLLPWVGPLACVVLLGGDLSSLWSFTLITAVALLSVVSPSTCRGRFSLLDLGLISFYVSSILSSVFAYDITTALPQVQLRTLFVLLYLALRSSGVALLDIVTASGLGMIIRCIESLVAFSRSYFEWRGLQFASLVDFRSSVTLTLHGERPGNYAAIYIASLALGIYGLRQESNSARRIKTVICSISITLSAVCILLSFSRSLYICSFLCVLLSTWGAVNTALLRKRAVIAGLVAVLLVLAVAVLWIRPIANAIGDTVLFGTRLSQERSTSGRLSIASIALHLATRAGMLGAGVSNYALEIRRRGLTSPSLLTAHAFNTALEVTTEQGIIGLAALVTICVGMITIIVRRFRTGHGKVLLGGYSGLLLYSMTQTFVIADQATATLLAVFCALAVQSGAENV